MMQLLLVHQLLQQLLIHILFFSPILFILSAYAKHKSQMEERKGRSASSLQDMRHECETRGVQSKCHICEPFVCGGDHHSTRSTNHSNSGINSSNHTATAKKQHASNDTSTSSSSSDQQQTCHFQIQGVDYNELPRNVPTVSDVPWAVGGTHRYDYGGVSTTHMCMYLNSQWPCGSAFGTNYSQCIVRCWGYNSLGFDGWTHVAKESSGEEVVVEETHPQDDHIGNKVEIPPWLLSSRTTRKEEESQSKQYTPRRSVTWSYPKTDSQQTQPLNPHLHGPMLYSPQGFTFTLAGSSSGQAGFQDGQGSHAR